MRPPALCAGRGFWHFSGVDRNRPGFFVFRQQALVQVAGREGHHPRPFFYLNGNVPGINGHDGYGDDAQCSSDGLAIARRQGGNFFAERSSLRLRPTAREVFHGHGSHTRLFVPHELGGRIAMSHDKARPDCG